MGGVVHVDRLKSNEAIDALGIDKDLLEKCCDWPLLHGAIREQLFDVKVRGIAMGQLVSDPLRTRAGSLVSTCCPGMIL